jgi:hypothetical protein
MKILDKTAEYKEFRVIPCGFTFLFEDLLYMPVKTFDVAQVDYNAVCLVDGQLYRFQPDAKVIPCVTEVHINQRGHF